MEYIDELEDILDAGRGRPFTSKISIDKEKAYDIIGEMRLNLPQEIRQAQKIIEDHDRIIEDAKNKATSIIKEAEMRADEITGDHEIYKLATEAAEKLVDEAKKYSRDVRIGTMNYVEEILTKTEKVVKLTLENVSKSFRDAEDDLNNTVGRIHENKQEIRGRKE